MDEEKLGVESIGEISGTADLGGPKRKKPEPSEKQRDVCFICFDVGELVRCGLAGCPKAYHPSCVNRNKSFFKPKISWKCGWHFCSFCMKDAVYKCYTCPFSSCKSCSKDAAIKCVQGNAGFCPTCLETVIPIENNEAQIETPSWENLFKEYYTGLKAKLEFSSEEIELYTSAK